MGVKSAAGERFELRLTTDQLARWGELARQQGTNLSQWLRDAAETAYRAAQPPPVRVRRAGAKPCDHPERFRIGEHRNFCSFCGRRVS